MCVRIITDVLLKKKKKSSDVTRRMKQGGGEQDFEITVRKFWVPK